MIENEAIDTVRISVGDSSSRMCSIIVGCVVRFGAQLSLRIVHTSAVCIPGSNIQHCNCVDQEAYQLLERALFHGVPSTGMGCFIETNTQLLPTILNCYRSTDGCRCVWTVNTIFQICNVNALTLSIFGLTKIQR